jgi:tRNA threonylcarbamoyl adenosine modification protein (Sua5/YciO/YrdC/YwlC family)
MARSVNAQEAARLLAAGEVVIIPTDTVYGLAADLSRREAIAAIFSLKGRPQDKPLPVLGATIDDLQRVAVIEGDALKLATDFWPGPLTLVLPRREDFTTDLGGTGIATVGVRIPASPTALDLLRHSGPLAVTSANASGESPASTAQEAGEIFPELGVLDGGPSAGEASTTAQLHPQLKVLRSGAISEEELRQSLMS